MPRALARVLLLPVALLLACGEKDPDLYDVSGAPARYRAVAETFAAEAEASGATGAVLGIIEDGELAYVVGVGRKLPGKDTRTGPDTLFRIGSVTKMMTALAVMQEVEAGRLELDDAVVEHVPGFGLEADDVSEVTVRQLLEHATGIADYLELDAPAGERDDAALEGFLTGRYATLGYLASPPGRFYNYSNPNFMLAGLVAETTSGLPYRQLMAERVFAPLGMDRTFFLEGEVLADGDFASARAAGSLEVIGPSSYDNPWGRPAGYAWSSVADLARYARFLVDGDAAVLAPARHAEYTSPSRDTQELLDLVHYGFGLQAVDGLYVGGAFRPARLLAHDGGIAGFSSNLVLLPEQRFGIVTLASGDGAYFPGTLVQALSTLPALPAPVPGPDLTPDPDTFGDEAGVYEDPNLAGTVTVALSGGALHIAIPEATAAGYVYDPVLVPLSPHNFQLTFADTPILLTFIHEGPGLPTWLRTRIFVAQRAP